MQNCYPQENHQKRTQTKTYTHTQGESYQYGNNLLWVPVLHWNSINFLELVTFMNQT